jgi:hypothetical protein
VVAKNGRPHSCSLRQRPNEYPSCGISCKINMGRGCSSMVELQLPKLLTWVRFPSPAPVLNAEAWHPPAHSVTVASSSLKLMERPQVVPGAR